MASAVQNQFNVLILVAFYEGNEPPFLPRLTYYFLSRMKHALSLPSPLWLILSLVLRHPHTPNIITVLILQLHALIESLPIRDPTLVWFQSKTEGLSCFPAIHFRVKTDLGLGCPPQDRNRGCVIYPGHPPPGLRSQNRNRNWSEPYSFGVSRTGTVFERRFWFQVQVNEANNSKKFK